MLLISQYYSSGNDLSAFAKLDASDIKAVKGFALQGKVRLVAFNCCTFSD